MPLKIALCIKIDQQYCLHDASVHLSVMLDKLTKKQKFIKKQIQYKNNDDFRICFTFK